MIAQTPVNAPVNEPDDLKVEELIAMVPLSDEYRKELLRDYRDYSQDQKFEIIRSLWRAYHRLESLYRAHLYQVYAEKMKEGSFQIPDDYDGFIDKEVKRYISEKKYKNLESTELSEIRNKLQTYISSTKHP